MNSAIKNHHVAFGFDRSYRFRILLSVISVCWIPGLASADTVWIAGQPSPRFGIIVRVNDDELVFDQRESKAKYKRQILPRSAVTAFHKSVDLERLERLDGESWDAYRDYAEELTEQKLDPECRDLAVQLYLIAAFHGGPVVRQSSLLGLMEVGRNPIEEATFRRLLLINANRSITNDRNQKVQDSVPLQVIKEGNRNLLNIVQRLRRGQIQEILKQLDEPTTKAAIRQYSDDDISGRLRQIAEVNRPTLSQLQLLVDVESALRFQNESNDSSSATADWSSSYDLPALNWITLPRLETATEFDLQKTIFRNGRWAKPSSSE